MKKGITVAAVLFLLCHVQLAVFVNEVSGEESMGKRVPIIFLHHSTGHGIWNGGMPELFAKYNAEHDTDYMIIERAYPSGDPYKWKNYPFDYWNIWINHAGYEPYMQEPALETLTQLFDVIIWKHCYPVSHIKPDTGNPDISSEKKTIENYKLQYAALKEKMHEYPDKRFIVWTGAALVKNNTNEEEGRRAEQFFDWVRNTWDVKGDNIYLWDLWELETEGGLYLKNEYASTPDNSHPNAEFNAYAAPFAVQRIIDVIEGRGDSTSILGK